MYATTLGLPEPLALRLRIALKLQAGHGYRVRLSDSVSAQTDLVLADASVGDHLTRLLGRARRSCVILLFTDQDGVGPNGVRTVARSKPLTELQPLLRTIFDSIREQGSRPDSSENAGRQGALFQLATKTELDCPNLRLQRGETRIILRRWASRVLARSYSEIISAAEQLNQPGWQIEPMHQAQVSLPVDWVSRSLDGFLIRSLRSGESPPLPVVADTPVRLRDWPDLGDADDPLALQIAALLCNRAWTASELARECSAPVERVSSLLWAFKAGRLLQNAQTASTAVVANARPARSTADDSRSGLLARLARRFGLQGSTT